MLTRCTQSRDTPFFPGELIIHTVQNNFHSPKLVRQIDTFCMEEEFSRGDNLAAGVSPHTKHPLAIL